MLRARFGGMRGLSALPTYSSTLSAHLSILALATVSTSVCAQATLRSGSRLASETHGAPIYQESQASIAERVSDLLKRMTLEEEIEMLAGTGYSTKPNARLGIPAMKMVDGSLGVHKGTATAFPSGISWGASFDPDLVYQVAAAIAIETRAKGQDMLLGPCVGISRIPFGGRNLEGMGEDPYLTSKLVTRYVRALNDNGVVGTVKHFALNDQETNRQTINSIADERTMHEIHLPAFESAVAEGVGSVMASYNLVNGLHSSENPTLLTEILKEQWGFGGFVVSDWGATHSTVPAALAGLDLEMPTPVYFDSKLLTAVQNGQVAKVTIDDKVKRILTQMFRIGLFDGADQKRPDPSVVNSPAHRALARRAARESFVLLKNSAHALPLDLGRFHKIAVIGPNGGVVPAGGGSSEVTPAQIVTPFAGLQAAVGSRASVSFAPAALLTDPDIPQSDFTPEGAPSSALSSSLMTGVQGLSAEYFNSTDLSGTPAFTRIDPNIDFFWDIGQSPDPSVNPAAFSARWSGKFTADISGEFDLQLDSIDGVRLWINDQLVIDNWTVHDGATDRARITVIAGTPYDFKLEYFHVSTYGYVRLGGTRAADVLLSEALALAKSSDAVILLMGYNDHTEGEGIDRVGFDLPQDQVQLIQDVAAVNPNVTVVINSGNPVGMEPWISHVGAVLYAWYTGQEDGLALADVLLGRSDPSGRLPISMPKRWEDSPAYGTFPGQNGIVDYQEGIYLGYRYYDTFHVEPQFPFGYGLSYTTFSYERPIVKVHSDKVTTASFDVSVTVTNTGKVAGKEVAQLYVNEESPIVDRPDQELKGFVKVYLQPGQSRRVHFSLDERSFAHYGIDSHTWTADPGRYTLRIGASSRDIRQTKGVVLK